MAVSIPQVVTEDRASGAQVVDGSLRFDDDKDHYLSRTPGSAGNRKTWTWAGWVKRSELSEKTILCQAASQTNRFWFRFRQDSIQILTETENVELLELITTAKYRDLSAWYHLVLSIDTTQTTESDRVRLYVNGDRVTSFSTEIYCAQNTDTQVNTTNEFLIGAIVWNVGNKFDGCLSNQYFIDGQALGPEYFGYTDPLTNTWRPKKFSGNYTNTHTISGSNGALPLLDTDDDLGQTASSPEALRTDSNSGNLSLALSFNSTGNLTDDKSSNSNDTTNNGVAASVTKSYYYGTSARFDGTDWMATPSSATFNMGTGDFTVEAWINLDNFDSDAGAQPTIFGNSGGGYQQQIYVSNAGKVIAGNTGSSYMESGTTLVAGNWYHIAVTRSSGTGRLFINGIQEDTETSWTTDLNGTTYYIGAFDDGTNGKIEGYLQDVRIYKGVAKYTTNFIAPSVLYGINSFHLPFDGSAPIGEDKSGNGNNWTPINFGGSNTLEKATGALPILNTDGGGKTARVGVRTDAYASNLVLALPLVGSKDDVSNQINSGSTTKTVIANGAVANSDSNFYGGSYLFDGSNDDISISSSTDFNNIPGDFTIEYWVKHTGTGAFQYHFSLNNTTYVYVFWTEASPNGPYLRVVIQSNTLYTNNSGDPYDFPPNEWAHIAVVRSGSGSNNCKLFVNGQVVAQATITTTINEPSENLMLGQNTDNDYYLGGNIQDFRVYKGVAKYTSNFIPASTNPDILPDTPSGVSGGSKLAKIIDGAVSFDGTNDSLSIADSDDFTFGSGDFTMEAFVYCDNASTTAYKSIVMKYTTDEQSSSWFWSIYNGKQRFYFYYGSSYILRQSSQFPQSAWVHCAIVRDGNTLRIFQNGIEVNTADVTGLTMNDSSVALTIGEDGQNNYDMSGFISNVRIIKGTALYTSDFTPPTAPLTDVTNTKLLCCKSNSSATAFDVVPTSGINDGTFWSANVSASTGTIVDAPLAFNGSTSSGSAYASSSASDTYIYVDFSPALSGEFKLWTGMSSGSPTATVTHSGGTSVVNLSSGENTLGTFTSVSRIAVNRGEAATHSFRAISVDGTVLTDPIIPNGNVAATNFNPFTTDINAVRGQESGYCTWNPLNKKSTMTLSNGNLTASPAIDGSGHAVGGTIGVSAGKWYWEYNAVRGTGGGWEPVVYTDPLSLITNNNPSGTAYGWGVNGNDGNLRNNNSIVVTDYFDNISNGDHIACALDMDNGKVWFAKNGIWGNSGNPTSNDSTGGTGLTGTWYPAVSIGSDSGAASATANFGQNPFKFPPPEGFLPLNAANARPSTVITRPNEYVGIVTYTGNGGTQSIITEFKPDFVWIKGRSSSTQEHRIFDSVRGAYNYLETNSTARENDGSTPTKGLTNFTSNGFTLLDNTDGNSNVNGAVGGLYSGDAQYVAWTWKAGGNSNTFNIDGRGYASASAAGLDGGTITPTGASVNTKSGFSIIGYTGIRPGAQTISHGLNAVPKFMIIKVRTNTSTWAVYHSSLGANSYLPLNTNGSQGTPTSLFNNTVPTSSVFTVGEANTTNENDADIISYLWAEIPGFSKFGSYTGNGSTDGPFVFCGFRPRWVMVKSSSIGGPGYNWCINDAARSAFNVSNEVLYPNTSGAEETIPIDILSNGFKIRTNGATTNGNGNTYIYAAFAEAPEFNLYGAQSNAR